MTDNEIFEHEIKCIKRRSSGQCNGGTDCCTCDLLLSDKDIVSAYVRAMQANETINSQKAEIERLKALNKCYYTSCQQIAKSNHEIKTEAIKEFAERLKETPSAKKYKLFVTKEDIDNLVKEMVGDD